jgi:AMMECR1 domain-containing protein
MKNKMSCLILLMWIGLLGGARPATCSQDLHPFDEISQTPAYQIQLKEILRQAIAHNFGAGGTLPQNLSPPFQKTLALFVTAKKGDQVLGCMGTLQAQQARMAEEIFFNLQKAFSQDPRHHPISQNQINGIEIVLTAVDSPKQINSIPAINPARDSVLIRHGRKEAVVLVGEARTLHYLLAFAKAKAGIVPGEPFQVYRLTTHILSIQL